MSASVNNLTSALVQFDENGVNIYKRVIETVYSGVVGVAVNGLLVTTGASGQTLPTTNVLQYMFRNTHATSVVTITATKQGGTGSVVANVGPGGLFVYWGATSGATEGYTAISLTPTVANTTFESFLAG